MGKFGVPIFIWKECLDLDWPSLEPKASCQITADGLRVPRCLERIFSHDDSVISSCWIPLEHEFGKMISVTGKLKDSDVQVLTRIWIDGVFVGQRLTVKACDEWHVYSKDKGRTPKNSPRFELRKGHVEMFGTIQVELYRISNVAVRAQSLTVPNRQPSEIQRPERRVKKNQWQTYILDEWKIEEQPWRDFLFMYGSIDHLRAAEIAPSLTSFKHLHSTRQPPATRPTKIEDEEYRFFEFPRQRQKKWQRRDLKFEGESRDVKIQERKESLERRRRILSKASQWWKEYFTEGDDGSMSRLYP